MGIWKYFLITIGLELPVVIAWLWPQWKMAMLIGFLVNAVTWPLLVTVYNYTHWNIIMLELFVVAIEAVSYRLFFNKRWLNCLFISFVANAISYSAGLLFYGA